MQLAKQFFRRPSTMAFFAMTALYAVCMGGVFWGTWSLDRAPIEPDNPTFYPVDEAARWFRALVAGHDFVPSDLMHVLGGMYFWQELQYALAGYLAALGLVFYLRGRGLSHTASYAGGAAYGLMGYTFTLFSAGHLGWFIWLMYGPFAFGLVDRAVRKGKWRNWALLGATLAWAAARQPDMWLLFTVLTFAYGVWTLAREWKRVRFVRLLCGGAVAAAVACAVGLPQFTRAITQDVAGREAQIAETSGKGADGKVDKSSDERWRFCTSWSLPPEDTAEFVLAEIHGGSNDPRVSPSRPYRGRLGQQVVVPSAAEGQRHPVTGEALKAGETIWIPYRQHSLYFGLVTVFFALLSLVGWWRFRKDGTGLWRDVPFWAVAGAVAYLCALGAFTPFYRLVYALPFGDTLRAPVKFVHLLEFCTAALAGFGFEAALHGFRKDRPTPLGGRILIVALAVANVLNLAHVDSKYCAVEDVAFMRRPNAAAEDILAAGGGKVFVAVAPQHGGKMVRDSLGVHLADVAETESGARFILVDGAAMRGNPRLNDMLKAGLLNVVGQYSMSQSGGIARASGQAAQFALLTKKNVPAPPPKEEPAPDRMRQTMALVSVIATFGVIAWGVCGASVLRRKAAI